MGPLFFRIAVMTDGVRVMMMHQMRPLVYPLVDWRSEFLGALTGFYDNRARQEPI
jgi:hypothetical protein